MELTLQNLEKLAKLIGPEWGAHFPEGEGKDYRGIKLGETPVYIWTDAPKKGRITVSPRRGKGEDITISMDKTIEQIAKDIKTRFIPGFLERTEIERKKKEEDALRKENHKKILQEVAEAIGNECKIRDDDPYRDPKITFKYGMLSLSHNGTSFFIEGFRYSMDKEAAITIVKALLAYNEREKGNI
jgi:hypothetical protein